MCKLFKIILITGIFALGGCKTQTKETPQQTEFKTETPFVWEGANVYFLLTDRFNNGDTTNDLNFERDQETAVLRDFKGGDIKGITAKIEEGYFDKLGINALWFTPVVEQIHGAVDEGTGNTYAYHGYWAKDWTALDPNFGTFAALEELVQTAHDHGIRIVMDVVLNHTGPVTEKDPFWGENWARQQPQCTYESYESTVACTLVANLPDIKTDSEEEVEIPAFLAEKWQKEGRFKQEMEELNTFFSSSGLKKTPTNYLVKWLTDYVRELGIDAYRVDTAKHVNEGAWSVLKQQAAVAFADWKKANAAKVLDDNDFFMLGEVYNYSIDGGREFNFGEVAVDYYAHGFDDLINFQFKYDAQGDYETLFAKYDSILHSSLKGKSVLNYATSHDDGDPFDKNREKPYETGTKLLLTPGLSQVYYGDETARNLSIAGTEGDATLRSFMNWDAIDATATRNILEHWQKLGSFRKNHPAIGAGRHKMITQQPYVFHRSFLKDNYTDDVLVGLDLPKGEKTLKTATVFPEGTKLRDTYSGAETVVKDQKITLNTPNTLVLLEKI
ncbi:alpha-amylase family glycosyl hydrolase [Flavimarina sp. Hel_I_48]|uniref:alpha-amylase family glycosyl hydrolase n=1 Tax=Flavimarina sp. Hel_I_48 TaxID=1392488 RepID=UPI0004DFA51C|nr:alpha-amylase family glycosyl hydrolase [Flavimarina sp. Hel_I_48]